MTFVGIIEKQLQVQRETYKIAPSELEGADKARYLRDMVQAGVEEFHEILRSYSWKPWHQNRPEYGTLQTTREEFKSELADVLVFLCNLALLEDVTTIELVEAFHEKLNQNQGRHQQ